MTEPSTEIIRYILSWAGGFICCGVVWFGLDLWWFWVVFFSTECKSCVRRSRGALSKCIWEKKPTWAEQAVGFFLFHLHWNFQNWQYTSWCLLLSLQWTRHSSWWYPRRNPHGKNDGDYCFVHTDVLWSCSKKDWGILFLRVQPSLWLWKCFSWEVYPMLLRPRGARTTIPNASYSFECHFGTSIKRWVAKYMH